MASAIISASRAGSKPGVWHVNSMNRRGRRVNSAHSAKQPGQVFGQPPDLAMGPVAVAGRIEDHRFVAVAAAQFALDELHARPRRSSGWARRPGPKLRVAAGPGDDVPRRIDVDDFGPGRGRGQRAAARVGEQLSTRSSGRPTELRSRRRCSAIHRQLSACSGNTPRWPKSVRFNSSTQPLHGMVHCSGQRAAAGPLALVGVAALEAGVGLLPGGRIGPRETPSRGRTRPVERDGAETLQPPAVAEVEQFVLIGSKRLWSVTMRSTFARSAARESDTPARRTIKSSRPASAQGLRRTSA